MLACLLARIMHGNRLQQVGMEGCGSGSASATRSFWRFRLQRFLLAGVASNTFRMARFMTPSLKSARACFRESMWTCGYRGSKGSKPPSSTLARTRARRGALCCHICTGTGRTRATSAPGPCALVPHLHRDWAHAKRQTLAVCTQQAWAARHCEVGSDGWH